MTEGGAVPNRRKEAVVRLFEVVEMALLLTETARLLMEAVSLPIFGEKLISILNRWLMAIKLSWTGVKMEELLNRDSRTRSEGTGFACIFLRQQVFKQN